MASFVDPVCLQVKNLKRQSKSQPAIINTANQPFLFLYALTSALEPNSFAVGCRVLMTGPSTAQTLPTCDNCFQKCQIQSLMTMPHV
jgi:hypothetical protein